jgi:hypothetical protein
LFIYFFGKRLKVGLFQMGKSLIASGDRQLEAGLYLLFMGGEA